MNIQELVNKRCLFSVGVGYNNQEVQEMKILEVSPSGQWVKMQSINGTKFWKPVTKVSLVEVLKDLISEPCPKI